MRQLALATVLLCTALSVSGATAEGPKIGLVLGGGGARGAAHVGVIRVLERMHIPIHCISGTSMGAVVGGLYAAGMTPDEMETALSEIDWPAVFQDDSDRKDRSFRRKRDGDRFLVKGAVGVDREGLKFPLGVVQGQKIDLLLAQLTARAAGIDDFDELRVPFRAVATDLATGEPVVLDGGSLAAAMRASMSIPGALAPVTIDEQLLVDGGVSNNVPIDVARDTCADVVIAVSLGAPLKPASEIQSVFAVTDQLTTIMTQQNTKQRIATLTDADVLIEPDLGALGTVDFDKAVEAISPGARATEDASPRLRRLTVSDTEYARYLVSLSSAVDRDPVIEFVRIENDSGLADEVIASKLRVQPGDRLNAEQLDEDIAKIYGMQRFESVDYETVREDGREGLVIRAKATSWGPNYLQFGLRLEDDLEGNSSFSFAAALTVTQVNELNAEWRIDTQIGQSPRFFTDFYQPLDVAGRFFVNPIVGYERFDLGVFDQGEAEAVYRVTETSVLLTGGVNFDTWGELRLGVFRGSGQNSVLVGSEDLPENDFDSGGYFAGFTYDTLNNFSFPTQGTLLPATYTVSDTSLGADQNYHAIDGQLINGHSWGKHSLVGNFKAAYTRSGELPLQDRFKLGGFLNLSGLTRNELSGQYLGYGSLVYYYRLDNASSIFSLPVYLGGSIEAGNTWENNSDFDFHDFVPAGSVFLGADTPLGPFYLARGQADNGRSNWYLFLGRTF